MNALRRVIDGEINSSDRDGRRDGLGHPRTVRPRNRRDDRGRAREPGARLLHRPQAASLPAARAVAFGTIAMGIGGSMTYGQTIGLTQNPEVIGNWDAWRWGMLGLGIKGAIWIGFAGLFLGMALGGQRYSGRDVFRLMLGMFVLYAAGWWMLNQPFDPANRILPRVYFSASWRWQPEAGDALRPRPEVWGGLLFALIGAWAWAAFSRGDRLAGNLALWGIVGGLGFPIGQCLQSWHRGIATSSRPASGPPSIP